MKEHKMSRRSFLKVGAVASAAGLMTAAPVAANAAAPAASTAADEENCFGLFQNKPKYIFLFIGDGMGTAQIQSARFYQGTVTNNGAITEAELSFTQFPEVGSVTTYDSTSFCPDSASTATSIASGKKTESGVINMCPWTRDVPYETCLDPVNRIFRVDTIFFFQSQIKTSDNGVEEWRSIEELRMQFHHFFQFRCAISIHFPQLWKKHVKVTRSLHPFVVPT